MELVVECPRCQNEESLEVEDIEGGSEDVQCPSCGAMLTANYSVEVNLGDVDVIEAPPVEFECGECERRMSIDDVDDESGEQEVECKGCGAGLAVQWSSWGNDVQVEALTKGEARAEEEEEDDDDLGDENDYL